MKRPEVSSALIQCGPALTSSVLHGAFTYLDDIMIVIETLDEHLKGIEYVLKKLVAAGLMVNSQEVASIP